MTQDEQNREQIRRATRSLMQNADGRKILVLGCNRGDGCSTMTQQIAACVARQRKSVTVLDCDLRTGSASENDSPTAASDEFGLAELLTDPQTDLGSTYTAPNDLYFRHVSRGCYGIDPDLLGSGQMRSAVERLAADCDYLMIDGSPAGDSTDAEFLAEHVDSVLLVVRSGQCTRSELKQVANRIRQSGKQFLGVILTQLDPGYSRNA